MAFVMNNAANIEQKCLIETLGVDKSYTTKRETIHVLNDTHLKIFYHVERARVPTYIVLPFSQN